MPCPVFKALVILGAIATAASASSCQAKLRLSIAADGSARIGMESAISEGILARADGIRSGEAGKPFFDKAAFEAQAAKRPGFKVVSCESSRTGIKASLSVSSLEAVIASDKSLRESGVISISTASKQTTLRLFIDRKNARNLVPLMGAMDPELLEILAPPAIDPFSDFSRLEYRAALGVIFGEKNLPAIDAGGLELTIAVPGEIVSMKGATLGAGGNAIVTIPLLDFMVLDKPIECEIVWKAK